MNVPLSEFEQIIDGTILERGFSYFKKGHVTDFVEISMGEYEAHVLGTEEYTVRLKIKDDILIEHNCNCPYDRGPVCKHIVASIFYLKQDELNLNQECITPPKKKKQKSVKQPLKKILSKVSYSELKEFIIEQSKINKQFKNLFLSYFAHLNESQSKEFYKRQIKSIIKSATDRYGFIGWHEMKHLEQGIDPIIAILDKQIESENFINAFYICTALMEEMMEALQCSDDSSGVLDGIIYHSYEMLYDVVKKDISEPLRTELFDYCIESFKNRLFYGWDWHIGMLRIASELVCNENDADIIIECLDTINGEYERESAQSFKLDIITKYKGKEEVQQFIEKHITNSYIRNNEIAKAIDNNEFERAIKLSKDGIEYNQKEKHGLVKDWYKWLLKIAQLQDDKTKIIEYARLLFIDSFVPKDEYYEILKQNVEQDKWNDFLEEIITENTSIDGWKNSGLVRIIFIKEKWFDRLFLMLKEDVSLQNIETNEPYLSKDYAQELIQLYGENLLKFVDRNMGRNHYQEACRYLRRMKKLGGNEKVNELIEYFRITYRKRRALLEELNRV